MKWRRMMLVGGVAVGAAAAYNRLVSRHARSLDENGDGDGERFAWHGRSIAYTRRGGGGGMPILLVHAIHAAASAREWQGNIEALAESGPVYAIDLLGFGHSERPHVQYDSALFLHLLDDFARLVIGEPCVLVASSLSGAFAAALGAQSPDRFPALVLIEPAGVLRLSTPGRVSGGATRVMGELPVVGTTLFNMRVSRARIREYLERMYADPARVTDALVESHYIAAHQPGARFAPAALSGQQLMLDARDAVRHLAQPTLLVWGERARVAPMHESRAFIALNPRLELTIIDDAGDLPHAEQPAEFNRVVSEFIASVARRSPARIG